MSKRKEYLAPYYAWPAGFENYKGILPHEKHIERDEVSSGMHHLHNAIDPTRVRHFSPPTRKRHMK